MSAETRPDLGPGIVKASRSRRRAWPPLGSRRRAWPPLVTAQARGSAETARCRLSRPPESSPGRPKPNIVTVRTRYLESSDLFGKWSFAASAEVGACAGCGGRLRRHLAVSADPRAWAVTRGGQARRRDPRAKRWPSPPPGPRGLLDIWS